jgi:hypothetical protein
LVAARDDRGRGTGRSTPRRTDRHLDLGTPDLKNERPQTQEFAKHISALAQGDAEWRHYNELYHTTFGQDEAAE